MGIGRKFQRPTVFQWDTVFENCELALRANKGVWHNLFTRLSPAQRARIDEVLEIVGPRGACATGRRAAGARAEAVVGDRHELFAQ